ncbi:General transcription factor II-I repeat domain-containing protein 2 [Frankliniella fusca]|uniref:General transcription factor II-I repeat domain-containing protein 2 n=1 Tax=Frankliniella fusca TaxID=407009 RepID=A0AAE1LHN5_9NEOP|nr:General transcription factor II-I repeat domain-containing protein 2 [Frankliniella fusca]
MEWFGLSWTKFVALVTDGALAMAGDVKDGLVFRVRNYLKSLGLPSDFPLIHCIIHQEALCAKTLPVDNVMGVMVMVKAVNKIRAHALNHTLQFQSFLAEIGCEFSDIPYYCDVRWLSRAKVLNRFFCSTQRNRRIFEK